ncbi:MAG TPA: 30S ribosomal protein S16 [Candidatus Saccharimonadales bacterium]
MQRTGRKGHAMFRVIVQDARRTPTSGKVVARLGSYDPHAKTVTLDKDKAAFYLEHGAQPSERVVRLLQGEGVKLPDWVIPPATNKEGSVRHAEKRRSTRPPEPEAPAEEATEAPAATEAPETTDEKPAEETPAADTPAEEPEAPAEETPADEPAAESEAAAEPAEAEAAEKLADDADAPKA